MANSPRAPLFVLLLLHLPKLITSADSTTASTATTATPSRLFSISTPPPLSTTADQNGTSASASATSPIQTLHAPESKSPDPNTDDDDTANNLVNMYFLILGVFVVLLVVAIWYFRRGQQRKRQAVASRQQNALQQDLELGGWRRGGAGWFRNRGRVAVDEREPPPPYTPSATGNEDSGSTVVPSTNSSLQVPTAAHVRDRAGTGNEVDEVPLPKYDDVVTAPILEPAPSIGRQLARDGDGTDAVLGPSSTESAGNELGSRPAVIQTGATDSAMREREVQV
ncbi:hypothetical protein RUND412_002844 [Rhizina undulata]